MRDFTLTTYSLLLKKLKDRNYTFLTFEQFIYLSNKTNFQQDDSDSLNSSNSEKLKQSGNSKISPFNNNPKQFVDGIKLTNEDMQIPSSSTPLHLPNPTPPQQICILRHDVDRLPQNSLATAKIENKLDITGTYYFRIVPKSFDKSIIKQIADLGHEIGYHYEDVDTASKKSTVKSQKLSTNEILELAWTLFKENLEVLRSIAPVKTICMHGSPLSKYDNKLLWTKYDYRKLGIIGEPYLDIDWNEFGYLTDTGRRWNGISVRDKITSQNLKFKSCAAHGDQSLKEANSILNNSKRKQEIVNRLPVFKSTLNIIDNIETLPNKIMIAVHPERWTNNWISWFEQLIWQGIKNFLKKNLIAFRGQE